MAELAGPGMYTKYGVHEGVQHCSMDDLEKLYLNNTWKANLSITGIDGVPAIKNGGNVVRAMTGVRLSMRLPPSMDPAKAEAVIREKMTTNVPYNAKVTLSGGHTGSGWCMKEI
jgi:hypothetical protein